MKEETITARIKNFFGAKKEEVDQKTDEKANEYKLMDEEKFNELLEEIKNEDTTDERREELVGYCALAIDEWKRFYEDNKDNPAFK